METRAAASKGTVMKNANKSARLPQSVITQQLPKSTPPQSSGNRKYEKKKAEEMKKKEEEERKRKQRERVRENRKWAESQDLTPYFEKLRREKGVSMHVSEEDRSSEELNTERAVVRSEPTTKEGESSHVTNTLPKTGIDLHDGTMSKNSVEDNRVEQSIEEDNTVAREGEREVVSGVEVVETINEETEKQGANTVTKEGEPEVVSSLEVTVTTNEGVERQVANIITKEGEPEGVAGLEVVTTTTKGQDIETPSRRQTNTGTGECGQRPYSTKLC